MINKNQELLSIIFLSYFSGSRITENYYLIKKKFEDENIPFEFIIIDDGSQDNSYSIALELERKEKNVSSYQLSKNYTSHYAVFAGLSVCKGDCATTMPDDFQQPIETYVQMYNQWKNGNKLIIPYRISRNDGLFKDLFSNIFYSIMNRLSVVKYPPGGCDIFLADREIVNILNDKIHPINTSSIVEVLRLGFNPVFIPFERPKVKTKSRWTFRKKIKQAADSFFTSSNFPIRLISYLGILTSLFSIILIIIVTLLKLAGEESLGGLSIPGWTTTVIFISFFSGLIIFSLGIIAEYIWRIYEEVKNRPGFIIKKKNK